MSSYGVSFWVPGVAKSERKRQRIVQGRDGRAFGHRTDEPDRRDWKAWVRTVAAQHCPQPLHGPLSLTLVFVRPCPSGTPQKPTARKPWPWAWMTKPDCDNLQKPLADAMSGVVWVDDAQVVRTEIIKQQDHGAAPGVLVLVREATVEDVSRELKGWLE